MQVGDWLACARQQLSDESDNTPSETPGLDLQVLVSHVLGQPRAWIVAHPETNLNNQQTTELAEGLRRLSHGEPLAYIIGSRHFMGLEFRVNSKVLIPRPETEELVECAISWLNSNPYSRSAADVGTGSGCIAASLAHLTPDLSVFAIDSSLQAIQIAAQNFVELGLISRIHPACGNLLDPVQYRFDLICANLPYIPSKNLRYLHVTQHEPIAALDGGPDGLTLIKSLLEVAPQYLAAKSLMLLEIDSSHAVLAMGLAHAAFPNARTALRHDLAGLPRFIEVENYEN